MSDTRPVNLEITASLFRVRRGLRVQFRARPEQPAAVSASGSAIARNLALGHRLVRALQNGEVSSFAELARMMGVSRAWVSMLVELTFLAPDLQQLVIHYALYESFGMVSLLEIARLSKWQFQRRRWSSLASERYGCRRS